MALHFQEIAKMR